MWEINGKAISYQFHHELKSPLLELDEGRTALGIGHRQGDRGSAEDETGQDGDR